jgi:hypothetical protein
MIGNMLEIGFGNFGMHVLDNVEGRMGNVASYAEPLQLWRRLSGFLVHFLLGVDVDRAIFGTMVGFIAMVHAV